MKVHGGRYLNETDLERMGVAHVGRNVMVHEHSNLVGLENIELGSNIRIDPYVVIVAAGTEKVTIGDFVHIGSGCSIAAKYGFEMGAMSTLSHGVRIFTVSDDYSGDTMTNPMIPEQYKTTAKGKVAIGRHGVIGAGSVILPGVDLGEGTAVGALSFVCRDLEPWGLYAGVPVRRLRDRGKGLLALEQKFLTELGYPAAATNPSSE